MRVKIIQGRCQGHARCAALVPEIFDLDENGYGCVLPGRETIANGDEQARERANLAIENCPETAICLDDE